ncbi:MAG: sulfatase-like hydrolase/transferase, partial [Bacteroidales bacterium]|nr:sulfatase-like hydrolase/transferase [Bacteroidales bacterium]
MTSILKYFELIARPILTFALTLFIASCSSTSEQPNIVFILADDMGHSDLNSYGPDKDLLRTPHIDRIAENGMRFTNASTPASICTPTRYGFLTGRYPWRSELKFGVTNPVDELLPDPERVTIADLLKKQGYNTAAIGKWHLGYGNEKPCDFTGKLTPGPLD